MANPSYHHTTPARVTLRACLDLASDLAIMGIVASIVYLLLAVEVAS